MTDDGRRRPFRAVEVLSGRIDRRDEPTAAGEMKPARKQISAQLEPSQIRLLGELHARLNATAETRIEKSDLVGLGIELLAALLNGAEGELASAPDLRDLPDRNGAGLRTPAALRTYVRTHVRAYESARAAERSRR